MYLLVSKPHEIRSFGETRDKNRCDWYVDDVSCEGGFLPPPLQEGRGRGRGRRAWPPHAPTPTQSLVSSGVAESELALAKTPMFFHCVFFFSNLGRFETREPSKLRDVWRDVWCVSGSAWWCWKLTDVLTRSFLYKPRKCVHFLCKISWLKLVNTKLPHNNPKGLE